MNEYKPDILQVRDPVTGEFVPIAAIKGDKGDIGPEGKQGPKGDPGEVTQADFDREIASLSEQIVGKKTAEGGEIFNDLVNNKATGKDSHAESGNTDKDGNPGTAYTFEMASTGLTEDITVAGNEARGDNSHAEGRLNLAYGFTSHVEGDKNAAIGWRSHVEGDKNIVIGKGSHAEGGNNIVKAARAHVEGSNNAIEEEAQVAHVEGGGNTASGPASHAEGMRTTASGPQSHAEGAGTVASGSESHAEGIGTVASGSESHAEGNGTIASGNFSHAEGMFLPLEAKIRETIASGNSSHAEGIGTIASGPQSHAEGAGTVASSMTQHVQGEFNIPDTNDGTLEGTPTNKYAHIVGNGHNVNSPSNAHTLDWQGNSWYQGDVLVGGTDMDDPNAISLKSLIGNLMLNYDFSNPINTSMRDTFDSMYTGKFVDCWEKSDKLRVRIDTANHYTHFARTAGSGYPSITQKLSDKLKTSLESKAVTFSYEYSTDGVNFEIKHGTSIYHKGGRLIFGSLYPNVDITDSGDIKISFLGSSADYYFRKVKLERGTESTINAIDMTTRAEQELKALGYPAETIIKSSTPGSAKRFRITVDDSGAIKAEEVV